MENEKEDPENEKVPERKGKDLLFTDKKDLDKTQNAYLYIAEAISMKETGLTIEAREEEFLKQIKEKYLKIYGEEHLNKDELFKKIAVELQEAIKEFYKKIFIFDITKIGNGTISYKFRDDKHE